MNNNKMIIFLVFILTVNGCSTPEDPFDKFIFHFSNVISKLEENKDSPSEAALRIAEYYVFYQQEIIQTNNRLKYLTKDLDKSKYEAFQEKMAPVIEKLELLMNQRPALFSNEQVIQGLKVFNIGL